MNKSQNFSISGAGGTGLIGLFCPLCVPAAATFLSSIGLGFLANAKVIFPLLGLFSLIFLYGLWKSFTRHKNMWPLIIGTVGIVSITLGNYLIGNRAIAIGGVVLAIGSAIWNIFLRKRCTKCK